MVWAGIGIGAAGLVVGVAGNLSAANKAEKQGEKMRDLANYEALQMERNAGLQIAQAQRQGMEEERKSRLMQSRALTLLAAGGGASDPTAMKILSDLAGEGEYRRTVAMYEGEEKSRLMRLSAVMRRKEGEAGLAGGAATAQAYQFAAAGTAIRGAGSLFAQKYGSTPVQTTNVSAGSGNIDSGGYAGVSDTSWSESAP